MSSSRKRLARLLVPKLTIWVFVVEQSKMPVVFRLHASLNLDWHVIVHLKHHVGLVLVLLGIAVLIGNDTTEERNGFACIPCSTACKVRVDHNCCKGDRTENITPFLVPVELVLEPIRLEVVVEAVIGSLPFDVFSKVLFQEVVIHKILIKITCCECFTEDVRTNTSHEKSISSSSRHFDLICFYF